MISMTYRKEELLSHRFVINGCWTNRCSGPFTPWFWRAWCYVAQNGELPVIYVSSHHANAKCCKYIFISLSSCTTQVEIQGENEQYPTNSEIDTNPVS